MHLLKWEQTLKNQEKDCFDFNRKGRRDPV